MRKFHKELLLRYLAETTTAETEFAKYFESGNDVPRDSCVRVSQEDYAKLQDALHNLVSLGYEIVGTSDDIHIADVVEMYGGAVSRNPDLSRGKDVVLDIGNLSIPETVLSRITQPQPKTATELYLDALDASHRDGDSFPVYPPIFTDVELPHSKLKVTITPPKELPVVEDQDSVSLFPIGQSAGYPEDFECNSTWDSVIFNPFNNESYTPKTGWRLEDDVLLNAGKCLFKSTILNDIFDLLVKTRADIDVVVHPSNCSHVPTSNFTYLLRDRYARVILPPIPFALGLSRISDRTLFIATDESSVIRDTKGERPLIQFWFSMKETRLDDRIIFDDETRSMDYTFTMNEGHTPLMASSIFNSLMTNHSGSELTNIINVSRYEVGFINFMLRTQYPSIETHVSNGEGDRLLTALTHEGKKMTILNTDPSTNLGIGEETVPTFNSDLYVLERSKHRGDVISRSIARIDLDELSTPKLRDL